LNRSFRALFFGSPAFAVPSLDALHAIAEIAAVVCQPDKPAGRGLELTAPAVKGRATELGLPVVQPTKLRTPEFATWARGMDADVALVVAYGRILPRAVLDAPRLGCVNVHASLLPKYRGAAPVTWSVVRGELETGITLMKLDEGMDTGPTFARAVAAIGPDETAGELGERLSRLGAEAVTEWLPKYVGGACTLEPQDDAKATLAPILTREDGRVAWTKTAREVHDHVRGMSPWPGAFTAVGPRVVKIHATHVVEGEAPGSSPGDIVIADKTRVLVACGRGLVELVRVQPEGRKVISATEWVAGRGLAHVSRLG
jgi:methionyl-tRNA formyltransferase